MTAPSTFVASNTYYHPDGTVVDGTIAGTVIEFKATDTRFKNNANIILRQVTSATLSNVGALSQTLVQATNGYEVTEKILGKDGTVRVRKQYHIAGTANINLGG